MAIERVFNNDDLHKAKKNQQDEFYTQYNVIQSEINAYLEYNKDVFRDKVILLPCDDPEWSNFTKYFCVHFEEFGIKKLISTSYAPNAKRERYGLDPQISIWELNSPNYNEQKTQAHGKIFTLERNKTADKNGDARIDIDDLDFDYLEGDGDFHSAEVTALRDEADIIITNPPFSLFREFLAWIVEADKQYSIIGNMNGITYKEVFPLMMQNKLWLGSSIHSGDRAFNVPDDYPLEATTCGIDENGRKFIRVKGVRWFTNLEHGKRHEPLDTMTMAQQIRFSKHKEIKGHEYQRYDNYDAIEIPYSDAIPKDYKGLMGVPISYMDKYCPEQFEILGCSDNGFVDDKYKLPHFKKHNEPYINGKKAYKRIFIRYSEDWIKSHPEDFTEES